ncbi:MAG: hypothetical protein OEY55_15720, partial [Acidimicrobiia bacterium]|nr:hypothetical protein [Acidimicrobiia bacterium]
MTAGYRWSIIALLGLFVLGGAVASIGSERTGLATTYSTGCDRAHRLLDLLADPPPGVNWSLEQPRAAYAKNFAADQGDYQSTTLRSGRSMVAAILGSQALRVLTFTFNARTT